MSALNGWARTAAARRSAHTSGLCVSADVPAAPYTRSSSGYHDEEQLSPPHAHGLSLPAVTVAPWLRAPIASALKISAPAAGAHHSPWCRPPATIARLGRPGSYYKHV
ncbi:hypothetical protein PLICRDRAFT_603868 [Plicaturopsis crispa FD-325 SS-3]|nr:hypothetical protein PLICRDRAFT_603868 [Plicaturopsis crispa FD-325 SS-3]